MSGHDNFNLNDGYLDVGSGHSLYYEQWGKADGRNVIFLHGGPGAGYHSSAKRFFDPTRYKVTFFDQRGAGKSKSVQELLDNTTEHLIKDIVTLMDHLNIASAIFFGGSWGSTLAILFSIRHANRVQGLVLRAFFASDRNTVSTLTSWACGQYRPEAYRQFVDRVPAQRRDDVLRFYYETMLAEQSMDVRPVTRQWAMYTSLLAFSNPDFAAIEHRLTTTDFSAHARITAHFASNDFFMPDNFVLENAHLIPTQIPSFLVHGLSDILCPVDKARQLNNEMPGMQLLLLPGGHASSEPEIERGLMGCMQRIWSMLS